MSIACAIKDLEALLKDRLQISPSSRVGHGQNEAYFPQYLPDAVAFPTSSAEVSQVVQICLRHGCPIVAYGAGTSLEGQHLPVLGGIALDMVQMGQVLEVRGPDLNVVVQPGCTRETLNQHLRDHGLFFPVDPGANASLGGMAATRASGTTAVRYGTMRENVLALEVVMADGRIIRTGTAARKSSTGYDLTHLMVGSEGTLGIITELTLRLQGIPEAISAATCNFESVDAAVQTVILTIQSGIPMARIEFVDEMMVRGFNLYANLKLPEKPHLFIEFHGSLSGVAEQAKEFGEIAKDNGAQGFSWAERSEDRAALWKVRHAAHQASGMLAPGKRTLATDICVPISHLAKAVTRAQDMCSTRDLVATIVGHVGDGNFHCAVRFDPGAPDEVAKVQQFSDDLCALALSFGGTISGEHGIGLGKVKYMHAQHGQALAEMNAIKKAFDPKGIFNPGKMLP